MRGRFLLRRPRFLQVLSLDKLILLTLLGVGSAYYVWKPILIELKENQAESSKNLQTDKPDIK